MTEYRWYRVQLEQSIPATQVLRRVIEVEVKVPRKCTEDELETLACNVAEKEAMKLDFTETIDPECDLEMIENEAEYYYEHENKKPVIVAVDVIGVAQESC